MIKDYFLQVWKVLSKPTSFFRDLAITGGVSKPLAFGLITHWIGSALDYLIQLVMGTSTLEVFHRLWEATRSEVPDIDFPGQSHHLQEAQERMMAWYSGTGAVITDPFLTLIYILLTSAGIYLGARALISYSQTSGPRGVTFESAVRIVSYSMAAESLRPLPFFGSGIAFVYTIILVIIGVREVYKIRTGRAVCITLFFPLLSIIPVLLIIGTLFGILMFLFFMLSH